MNELDKADLQPETANPVPDANVSDAMNEENCKSEETSECVETSSPALDIESVADAKAADENVEMIKRIHSMDKATLVETLKQIVEEGRMDANKEVDLIKSTFYNIKSRESLEELNAFVDAGNDPAAFTSSADEYEPVYKEYYAKFKELRNAYLAEEEARKQKNLEDKLAIIEKLKAISEDIDNINTRYAEFKQLDQDFKAIKDVPESAVSSLSNSFQKATEEFYDHLNMNKELRDLDFKKNLSAKRQLIEEAKALENEPDVIVAFRKLQDLHNQWRELGPVAKDLRESIWEEFKAASTLVNKRHQEYFELRKAKEQANEEGKTALCEQAEAIDTESLTTFAQWDEATKTIIDLQKRWKEYGFASRKANNLLFGRFRKACDNFFEKKMEFFRKAKEDQSENLAKKIALCEKAEALKDTEDVKKATEEVVKLQNEWKKIGSVPRKQSDAVWQRFTTACNHVFDLRKQLNSARRQEENANLAAKKAVIEKLKAIPAESDRKDVGALVRKLQQEWNEIGFVPFKMKDKIYDEYHQAVDALYTSFNLRENKARMANFKEDIDAIKGDSGKLGRERDRLMRVLEAKKNDLKNIENNMGFFNVKSSAGNSILKDMERRVKRLKEEMAEIEQKLALLNN